MNVPIEGLLEAQEQRVSALHTLRRIFGDREAQKLQRALEREVQVAQVHLEVRIEAGLREIAGAVVPRSQGS